jgi:hypothetical protein
MRVIYGVIAFAFLLACASASMALEAENRWYEYRVRWVHGLE